MTQRLVLALIAAALLAAPFSAQEKKNASDQGAPDPQLPRGARRTPPHKIAEAMATGKATVFRHVKPSIPAQVGVIPPKLSYWGNNQYGDCVSAESASAIASYSTLILGPSKEVFVTESTLISWARSHGVLNGADLLSVAQSMQRDGIKDENGILRKTGTPASVDYTNEATLQAAIAQGQVSIAIAANSLPNGAGNQSGWYSFGSRNNHNTDHCVGLLGYGPKEFVFGLLNTPVPSNAPSGTLYLLFTWNTIGVVDAAWIKGTTEEAWLRTPTVVGIDPLPPDPVGITITPASASLAPGATQQFSATLIPAGQDSIVWTASGGGITASGLYTAPSQVGNYSVKAALLSNPARYATAPVTVSASPQPPNPAVVGTFVIDKAGKYDIVPSGTSIIPPGMELAPAGTAAKLAAIQAILKQAGLDAPLPKEIPEPFKIKPKEPEKNELENDGAAPGDEEVRNDPPVSGDLWPRPEAAPVGGRHRRLRGLAPDLLRRRRPAVAF